MFVEDIVKIPLLYSFDQAFPCHSSVKMLYIWMENSFKTRKQVYVRLKMNLRIHRSVNHIIYIIRNERSVDFIVARLSRFIS